jgi:hypothetical protein
MGVEELVLFDPDFHDQQDRIRWQLYRRGRGKLNRVEATTNDRVRSRFLGCFLRSVGDDAATRVRLGTGPQGNDLFPTAEELERAGRLKAEAMLKKLQASLRNRKPR